MTCVDFQRTSAYLDGELDAAASLDAESHLATCLECQGLAAASSDARELLRGPAARVQAPALLRVRISKRLDQETVKGARLAPPPPRRQFWLGAASGVGASAIAAAIVITIIALPAAESLTDAAIDAHINALSLGRTIDVASSSHHTVKPWFAGRAPLSPPVSDFSADGFALVGGRVDVVSGRQAAVVVYRHGAHELDLYAWPSRGAGPLPKAERRGYHMRSWKDRDLTLAAISDIGVEELDRFERLVQAAGE